ncbi:hypothetical protein DZD36_00430, partial [Acinetobacter baumannii]
LIKILSNHSEYVEDIKVKLKNHNEVIVHDVLIIRSILNDQISKILKEGRANSNMRCDSFKSHMIINKLSKFL